MGPEPCTRSTQVDQMSLCREASAATSESHSWSRRRLRCDSLLETEEDLQQVWLVCSLGHETEEQATEGTRLRRKEVSVKGSVSSECRQI